MLLDGVFFLLNVHPLNNEARLCSPEAVIFPGFASPLHAVNTPPHFPGVSASS